MKQGCRYTQRSKEEIFEILLQIAEGYLLLEEAMAQYGVPRSTLVRWLRKYRPDLELYFMEKKTF